MSLGIRPLLAVFLTQAVLAAGLAPAQAPGKAGSVEGKVTFNGQPLPGGTVALHPEKGKRVVGQIQADGSYSVKDVPAAKVRVTVETESVKPKPGAPAGGAKYVPIPVKYADPKTSGLTYEVKPGKQTLDLDLR